MKAYMERASASGLEWVKSSYSGNAGNCVEVAALPLNCRALRDSKNPDGPALIFTGPEFTAFIAATRTGGFDRA